MKLRKSEPVRKIIFLILIIFTPHFLVFGQVATEDEKDVPAVIQYREGRLPLVPENIFIPPKNWKKIVTENFIFHYNPAWEKIKWNSAKYPDLVKKASLYAEDYLRGHLDHFKCQPLTKRISVVIAPTTRSAMSVFYFTLPKPQVLGGPWRGIHSKGIMVFDLASIGKKGEEIKDKKFKKEAGRAKVRDLFFDVLPHEIAHAVEELKCAQELELEIPPWAKEGFSSSLESKNVRIVRLRKFLSQSKTVPTKDLFSLQVEDLDWNLNFSYPEVYATIGFLIDRLGSPDDLLHFFDKIENFTELKKQAEKAGCDLEKARLAYVLKLLKIKDWEEFETLRRQWAEKELLKLTGFSF